MPASKLSYAPNRAARDMDIVSSIFDIISTISMRHETVVYYTKVSLGYFYDETLMIRCVLKILLFNIETKEHNLV